MFQALQQKWKASDRSGEVCPRKPMTALLLSICPGLGQQYAGHLVRGIVLYVILIIVSWLAAIWFMYIDSRFSMVLLATPFVGVAAIAVDAYLLAKKQPQDYKLKWFNKRGIYAAVFLFLLFTINPLMDMLVGSNVVRAFFFTSSSMYPTILKNDLLVVNKLAKPVKGDIALIDFSNGKKRSSLTKVIDSQLVRRIIAGPGDTVEIHGRNVVVNGQQLDETYTYYGEDQSFVAMNAENQTFGPETVPAGSYFVLGDNRTTSLDSRILGFIEEEKLGGKVTKVFWSWNYDENHFLWDRTAMTLR